MGNDKKTKKYIKKLSDYRIDMIDYIFINFELFKYDKKNNDQI